MGEYARQYALDRHGVDIGDDMLHTVSKKHFSCSCGRAFISSQAREQHQKDTGHQMSKAQKRKEKGDEVTVPKELL